MNVIVKVPTRRDFLIPNAMVEMFYFAAINQPYLIHNYLDSQLDRVWTEEQQRFIVDAINRRDWEISSTNEFRRIWVAGEPETREVTEAEFHLMGDLAKISQPIRGIKFLREQYGLSLYEAKQLFDAIKEAHNA